MSFVKHFSQEIKMICTCTVPKHIHEELLYKKKEVDRDLRTHIVLVLGVNLFLFPFLIVFGIDKVLISVLIGLLMAFAYARLRMFIHSFWMGLKDGLDGKDWNGGIE